MNFLVNIKGKEYRLTQDFTASDEYNETLDSGTIIISDCDYFEDLEPYDDVFIYSETDKNKNKFVFKGYPVDSTNYPSNTEPEFYRHFLVDQYSEEQLFFGDELHGPRFKYTIQLFSETKGLETISLPNISITQPLNSTKKISVYNYALRFLNIYNKTSKIENGFSFRRTWSYANKYKLSSEIFTIFKDTYSPDFTLNAPNLRDLFNKLFIVKDCIPYVKDDVIYAMNISERTGEFDYTKGELNYVSGSKTSDGYCTDLRRNYTDALSETKNGKYIEYLGFRNSDSALMTFNDLRIETKFPIYKINKMYMCYYKPIKIVKPANERKIDVTIDEVGIVYSRESGENFPKATISVDGEVYEISSPADYGNIAVIEKDNTTRILELSYDGDYINSIRLITANVGEEYESSVNIQVVLYTDNETVYKIFLCKQDISSLVKLESERNLLWQDPALMAQSVSKIEDLAKFKLATIGYSIGSNSINGWGTVYSYPQSFFWQNKSASYIENIFNFMDENYPVGIYDKAYIATEILNSSKIESISNINIVSGKYPVNRIISEDVAEVYGADSLGDLDIDDLVNATNSTLKLKSLFFEIEYQPFYNGSVIHSKNFGKDGITINDNQQQSLTLLRQDGIAQLEKINRFSNKTLQIMARYSNINDVQKLGSVYNKEPYSDIVIYHREMSISANVVTVVYYGAKDYVLKNYFTSVFARYRTYNLMSYGESVTRSENEKLYILMSKDKSYKDLLNVELKEFDTNDSSLYFLKKTFSFFVENMSYKQMYYNEALKTSNDSINGGFIVYDGVYYASDINAFVSGNSICLNIAMYDNVSMGVYIKQLITDTLTYSSILSNADVYKTDGNYTGTLMDYHYIIDDTETGQTKNLSFVFCNVSNNYIMDKEFYDKKASSDNNVYSKIVNAYQRLYELPKVYENDDTDDEDVVLKNIISFGKDYYLDNKEKMDMTFQIEVLNDETNYTESDVLFSDNMLSLSDLISDNVRICKGYKATNYTGSNIEIEDFSASIDFTETIVRNGILRAQYPVNISFKVKKDNLFTGVHVVNNGRLNFPSQKHGSIKGVFFTYKTPGYSSYVELNQVNFVVSSNQAEITFNYYRYFHAGLANENTLKFSNISTVFEVEEVEDYYIFSFDGYEMVESTTDYNGLISSLYIYETGAYLVGDKTVEILGISSSQGNKLGTRTASRNDAYLQFVNTYIVSPYAKEVEYENNLYFVLCENNIKKYEIYDEYSTLPENFIEINKRSGDYVMDILKDEDKSYYLGVNFNTDISNYKSFRCYYFDGDVVEKGKPRSGKFKFVFAINDIESNNKVYLSLLRSRDERINDSLNMNTAKNNFNYSTGEGVEPLSPEAPNLNLEFDGENSLIVENISNKAVNFWIKKERVNNGTTIVPYENNYTLEAGASQSFEITSGWDNYFILKDSNFLYINTFRIDDRDEN